MCALKKEGLGCLPAEDRSAVLNLTMPKVMFMTICLIIMTLALWNVAREDLG